MPRAATALMLREKCERSLREGANERQVSMQEVNPWSGNERSSVSGWFQAAC